MCTKPNFSVSRCNKIVTFFEKFCGKKNMIWCDKRHKFKNSSDPICFPFSKNVSVCTRRTYYIFYFHEKTHKCQSIIWKRWRKFFGWGIIPRIIISGTMYYFHNCADIFGQIRTPIVDRSSFFMENIIGGLLIEFF